MCLVFGLASQAYRTVMLTVPPKQFPAQKQEEEEQQQQLQSENNSKRQNTKQSANFSLFIFASRFSFFMCIYGKMQIATCNNKQHVQADECVVCSTCVLHWSLSSPFSLYLLFVTLLPRGFCRCCCCLHGNLSSQRIAFNCNFATLQLPQSATATTATTAHPTPSYIPSAMSSRQQRKKLCKTPCDAANVKRCAYKECVFVLPHTHVAACNTKSKRNAPTTTEGKGLGKVKSWRCHRLCCCSAGQAAPTNQIKEIQRTRTDNEHTRATTANKTKQ